MTTIEFKQFVQNVLDAANRLNAAAPNREARLALEDMDRESEKLLQALHTTGLLSANEAGEAYLDFFTPDDATLWVEFDGVHRIVIDIESGAAERKEC